MMNWMNELPINLKKKDGVHKHFNWLSDMIVITCKDGKLNGLLQFYSSSGDLRYESNYQDDKLNGTHKSYYNSGKLHIESNYKDGVLDGEYLMFDENGKLDTRKNYQNGVLEGKFQSLFDDGQVQSECNYVNGKIEGEYLSYYYNGRLESKKNYKNGIEEGKYEIWYKNGQKHHEHNFVNGALTKESKTWDEKGNLIYHNDGKRIIVLTGSKNRNCALPDGEFECWKACRTKGEYGVKVYVKLLVPAEAKRLTTKTGKGRVEYATVTQIVSRSGYDYKVAYSFVHKENEDFFYVVGEKVKPHNYDDDHTNENGPGIGVFLHKDLCDRYF